MSNHWLRLWHDMPTDPKWRTIARHSKQPIGLVQAVYLHLLVDASRNVTRGHINVTPEDLASALDCDEDSVHSILDAMQGRVLEGKSISGWGKRQPAREDAGSHETGAKSAAERKREQRAREKQEKEHEEVTQCHEASRNVTTDKDKDKDKDLCTLPKGSVVASKLPTIENCPHQKILDLYAECLPDLPQPRMWEGQRKQNLTCRWRWVLADLKAKGKPCDADAGLEFFRRFFAYVGDSAFLTGRGGQWQADLGWLCKAENFAKVLQGNYETRAEVHS